MTAFTPRMLLTLADASQGDKSGLVNGDLEQLEALLGGLLKSRTTASPPVGPQEGDCYATTASPGGLWASNPLQVARYRAGTWTFYAPVAGVSYAVQDESYSRTYWNGTIWASITTGGLGSVSADTSPVLGGNLSGGNFTFDNWRAASATFSDAETANAVAALLVSGRTLTYSGTARTLALPKLVKQDTFFNFIVRSAGALTFSLADGVIETLVNRLGNFRLVGAGAAGTAYVAKRTDDGAGNPTLVEWHLLGDFVA